MATSPSKASFEVGTEFAIEAFIEAVEGFLRKREIGLDHNPLAQQTFDDVRTLIQKFPMLAGLIGAGVNLGFRKMTFLPEPLQFALGKSFNVFMDRFRYARNPREQEAIKKSAQDDLFSALQRVADEADKHISVPTLMSRLPPEILKEEADWQARMKVKSDKKDLKLWLDLRKKIAEQMKPHEALSLLLGVLDMSARADECRMIMAADGKTWIKEDILDATTRKRLEFLEPMFEESKKEEPKKEGIWDVVLGLLTGKKTEWGDKIASGVTGTIAKFDASIGESNTASAEFDERYKVQPMPKWALGIAIGAILVIGIVCAFLIR